ncbi:hypothetical protein D3C76_1559340 [compost metagenome]
MREEQEWNAGVDDAEQQASAEFPIEALRNAQQRRQQHKPQRPEGNPCAAHHKASQRRSGDTHEEKTPAP